MCGINSGDHRTIIFGHFMVFGMITAGIHQVYLGIMIWNLGIDIDLITVVFDGIWYRFLTCYICRWYLMAF